MDRQLTQQQLSRFLVERIVQSPGLTVPLFGQPANVTVVFMSADGSQSRFTEAEALGSALANDVGFQAMRLGTWLNTPDGALIETAVAQVLPPGFSPEYQLVIDALRFAATKQRQAGWQRAAGIRSLAGLGLLAMMLARRG
jgi:hypothetical protein